MRRANGTWAPGTSGNPAGQAGNRGKHQQFTRQWLKNVKIKDIKAVYQAIVTKATQGDMRAIKLFLDFTILKPHTEIDISEPLVVKNPDQIRQQYWEFLANQPKADN